MEGGYPQTPYILALHQLAYAGFHLSCRLISERHRCDMPGRDALFNQIGNFFGDDPGLAASRSGQHQQGMV